MNDSELEQMSDRAFARLEAHNGDLGNLSEVDRVLVVIYSVQGVIDNGGLRAFFGANWPGEPEYTLHADAYRQIGATESAKAIAMAATFFPFARPEQDCVQRSQVLQGPVGERIEALPLTPSEDVWRRLARYARRRAPPA